jgi:hypothetical protein
MGDTDIRFVFSRQLSLSIQLQVVPRTAFFRILRTTHLELSYLSLVHPSKNTQTMADPVTLGVLVAGAGVAATAFGACGTICQAAYDVHKDRKKKRKEGKENDQTVSRCSNHQESFV